MEFTSDPCLKVVKVGISGTLQANKANFLENTEGV